MPTWQTSSGAPLCPQNQTPTLHRPAGGWALAVACSHLPPIFSLCGDSSLSQLHSPCPSSTGSTPTRGAPPLPKNQLKPQLLHAHPHHGSRELPGPTGTVCIHGILVSDSLSQTLASLTLAYQYLLLTRNADAASLSSHFLCTLPHALLAKEQYLVSIS